MDPAAELFLQKLDPHLQKVEDRARKQAGLHDSGRACREPAAVAFPCSGDTAERQREEDREKGEDKSCSLH
jgi:hypothetical protein